MGADAALQAACRRRWLTAYDSRAAWEALFAGGITREDFNSFGADVLMRSAPIAHNGFSMTADAGPLGDESNKIDVIRILI